MARRKKIGTTDSQNEWAAKWRNGKMNEHQSEWLPKWKNTKWMSGKMNERNRTSGKLNKRQNEWVPKWMNAKMAYRQDNQSQNKRSQNELAPNWTSTWITGVLSAWAKSRETLARTMPPTLYNYVDIRRCDYENTST